jgi:hypothetical protein
VRCEWWKHGDVDADGPSATCETEDEIRAWLASPAITALRAGASGGYVPMFFVDDAVTGQTRPLSPETSEPSEPGGRPEL